MASLDKQSVREQLDGLKAQHRQLAANGKLSVEGQALFIALTTLLDIIVAVFMEKITQKDSRNSRKPSSQTEPDTTALTPAGKIGSVISEATILAYVLQLHHALERWQGDAIQQLLASPALHADETSQRVDKKNQWLHVYSAGLITVKCLHQSRGMEAVTAINIIPRYAGTLIHDCLAQYLALTHCSHGLCGSPILRKLTFVVDSNGYAWAIQIKALLKATAKRVAKRKTKKLTQPEHA